MCIAIVVDWQTQEMVGIRWPLFLCVYDVPALYKATPKNQTPYEVTAGSHVLAPPTYSDCLAFIPLRTH